MQRKAILLFTLVFVFLFSSYSYAKEDLDLNIKDKTITNKEFLDFFGSYKNLVQVKVNNVLLKAIGNTFDCGIVLSSGKNYMEVELLDKFGKLIKKSIRILRLVSFPDVEKLYNGKPHWAKNEIISLATLGIIEGYPDNNFYLNKEISRGEFATWLCRAKGLNVTDLEKDLFSDVPKEHWRAPYINEIVKYGYMDKKENNQFLIDMPITRGEAAVIGVKAEEKANLLLEENQNQPFFVDVLQNHPFFKEINLAKTLGLVKGVSKKNKIFDPDRNMTRGEATIFLSRFARVNSLVNWLYSFNEGFSQDELCQINTSPEIIDVEVFPVELIIGAIPAVTVRAKIRSREGLSDILNVKADISGLGGPPDALMNDNGIEGDLKIRDGEYAIRFVASLESTGEKIISVTATDRLGWQDVKETKILVVK